jgi:S-formylglutathione hydrolase FrmB
VYVFLHGAGGQTHTSNVPTVTTALEGLIADGLVEPMVVVFPGFAGAAPGHEPLFLNIHLYRNSSRNGQYEDAVMVDLMDWLYTTSGYNISADREERAIGGFSDGAAGCVYLAVRHSDQFAAFVAHSGELAIREYENFVPLLLAETPGPPYTFDPVYGYYNLLFFGRSSAYSPNLVNPNYPVQLVDFPVDSSGDMIPSVFEDRWIADHDPATLIADPEVYTDPLHMYFSCNTEDDGYAFNVRFSDELTALGITHKFRSSSGFHTLDFFTVRGSLRWLNNKFNAPPSDIPDIASQRPAEFVLEQNRPNPFHPATTIPFSLSRGASIEISVFNAHGQRVRTLVDGYYELGTHLVPFDATGQASGIYWYELTVDGQRTARKMLLAR